MPADVLREAGKEAAPSVATTPAELGEAQKNLTANYNELQRKSDVLESIWRPKIEAAQSERQKFIEGVVSPAAEQLQETVSKPLPSPPSAKPDPPVPQTAMRPFGDPRSGQTAQSVISTLGLLAQMVAGLVSKTPAQALGAYQGALEGWVAGDKISAEREWRRYLGEVDKGARENANALREWEAVVTQYGANQRAAQAVLAARMNQLGFYDRSVDIAEHGLDGALKNWDRERGLWTDLQKSSQHLTEVYHAWKLKEAIQEQTAELQKARVFDILSRVKERSGGLAASGYDDATLDRLAAQYAAGEKIEYLVRGRTGASTKAGIEIQRRGEKMLADQGKDAEALILRRRSLAANTKALDQITKAESDFNSFLTTFENTSKNTLRLAKDAEQSGVPAFNRLALKTRVALGDVNAKNYSAQMDILAQEMARVTTRQRNTTVEARNHARETLDSASSYQQLESLVRNVLEKDAEYGRAGFQVQREALREAIADPSKQEQAPPSSDAAWTDVGNGIRIREKR